MREVARLLVELLDVEAVAFHSLGRGGGRDPLRGKVATFAHASDVGDEETRHAQEHIAWRVPRALDEALAGADCRRDVAASPGVGQVERRRLGASRHELGDLALGEALARRPGRELVDLRRKLLGVLADELDDGPGGLGVDLHAALGELRLDPARQVGLAAPLREVVEEDLACLRDRLGERRVALDLLPGQREHRRRRRALEVLLEALHLGRLPALDVLDDDESPLDREEAERVAGGLDVLAHSPRAQRAAPSRPPRRVRAGAEAHARPSAGRCR